MKIKTSGISEDHRNRKCLPNLGNKLHHQQNENCFKKVKTSDTNNVKRGNKCPKRKKVLHKTPNNLKSDNVSKAMSSLANIMHKNSTGDVNWTRFLQEQKINPKKTATNAVKNKFPKQLERKRIKFTKVVGLDCEMVGIGEDGKDNMLARVSLVNSLGDCLYDKFVKPREEVTDYRTAVSGVRPDNLDNAEDFETVQKEVASILKGRILVGHSLKNDMSVLFLTHPRWATRDTSKYFREPGTGTPSLKKLANKYLGVVIQEGEHSSVEDARAAVQLYNMFKKDWEAGGGAKKSNHINHLKSKVKSNELLAV